MLCAIGLFSRFQCVVVVEVYVAPEDDAHTERSSGRLINYIENFIHAAA